MFRLPLPLLSIIIVLLSLLAADSAFSAVQIPMNLNKGDREAVLKIVGLGTGAKILSEPYPLGGYSGFEFGLGVESLPIDDIARLGSGLATPQQEIVYPTLTIGKGVYNDIDLFLQFTPFRRQDELSLFGAMARWGFYQGQYLPISGSFVLHASNGNIGNVLNTRTFGFDFMSGITVNQISLFAGLGWMQSNGTFVGGANGVAGGTAQEDTVSGLHTVIGANLRVYKSVFVVLQMDRTEVPVISGKLGLRF